MAGEGPEQGPERGPEQGPETSYWPCGAGLWELLGLWGALGGSGGGLWGIPARALRGALSKAPGGAPTWSRGWGVRGSGRVLLGALGGWWGPPQGLERGPEQVPDSRSPTWPIAGLGAFMGAFIRALM